MHQLAEMTEQELSSMFRDKKNVEIEIPADVAQFNRLEVDFSTRREVPPSPAGLSPELMAHIILFGGNDLTSKYLVLVLFVYAYGGGIFYTQLPSENYKAEVVW